MGHAALSLEMVFNNPLHALTDIARSSRHERLKSSGVEPAKAFFNVLLNRYDIKTESL